MRRAAFPALALVALLAPAHANEPPPPGLLRADGVDLPPLLPTPLASFGMARAGDYLYVYSGHLGPVHAHSRDSLWDAFARLDLQDGRSWELLPCPQPAQSVALVAHQGALIRVGGLSARNRAGEDEDLVSLADVVRYDPLTRAWKALPPLPEPRSSHDAAVLGDTLYVVGGWWLDGTKQVWHTTALALDLAAPEPAWRELPKPPFPERRAIALVAADEQLLALGGMTWEDELTREVWLYDPAARTWSRGPDLPFRGFGVAATAVGRDVYASGLDSHLFRLGLHGGEPEWEDLGALALPRYFHRMTALDDDRLLVVGGVARPGGHARVCELIDLDPRRRPQLSWLSLPSPARAKNRQALWLERNVLHWFGGNSSLEQHDFAPERFLREGWRLNLATLRCEPRAPLPVARQSQQVVLLAPPEGSKEGVPLVLGGFGHDGQRARSWPELFRYDAAEDTWSAHAAQLPRPRTQFGAVERAGKVYVFGGLDYDAARPEGEAFQYPIDVLALEGEAFAPAGFDLPRPRRAFGAALLGERYYLVGGMREQFTIVEEVDAYDFAAGRWVEVARPRAPRLSPELVAVGGKLYLLSGASLSGEGDLSPCATVEVYDPATDSWSVLLERLPLSPVHMRALPWGERILCFSTQVEDAAAVRLLVIRP